MSCPRVRKRLEEIRTKAWPDKGEKVTGETRTRRTLCEVRRELVRACLTLGSLKRTTCFASECMASVMPTNTRSGTDVIGPPTSGPVKHSTVASISFCVNCASSLAVRESCREWSCFACFSDTSSSGWSDLKTQPHGKITYSPWIETIACSSASLCL